MRSRVALTLSLIRQICTRIFSVGCCCCCRCCFCFFWFSCNSFAERKAYKRRQWTNTNHQVHIIRMQCTWTTNYFHLACVFFFQCCGCYYFYFEPADWAHSEIRNTKPYLCGSPCYTRCAYLSFLCVLCIRVGSFVFKEQLIHEAGYTIYFCIISKRLLFAFAGHFFLSSLACRWFEFIYFPFRSQNYRITH